MKAESGVVKRIRERKAKYNENAASRSKLKYLAQ
jgi:hypothetical protein